MPSETIVAVFDTAAQAESAVSALEADGIPASAVKHYAKSDMPETATTTSTTERKGGFWAWILGEEGSAVTTDHALYDRSLESGGMVVTVVVDRDGAERVMEILEAHEPVDLDQRVSSYGLPTATGPSAPMVDTTAPVIATAVGTGVDTSATSAKRIETDGREEVIPLSEETLDVGKRTIDRGTTRLRRYVVERPVEEQIALRNETVSITRRAVMSAASAVPGDAFTDKTVEFTEMSEEAIVAKTARVHEEVVVSKQVDDRVETVRDTVRREEVEVEKDGVVKPPVAPVRRP